MSKEVMKLALDALMDMLREVRNGEPCSVDAVQEAMAALRAELARPEAQPVAWKWELLPGHEHYKRSGPKEGVYLEDPASFGIPMDHQAYRWTKLYDAPQPPAEQGAELSDAEIMRHWDRRDACLHGRLAVIWFARAVIDFNDKARGVTP